MKRLYWTEPDTFEAEVDVAVVDDCTVTIDPILFHPDEGGQPADLGAIGAANVLNVEIVAGRIVHRLDKPLAAGRHVARVDQQRRRYTAGHHTAQHIISGLAEEKFGLKTTGVHIGLQRCTVDFDPKIEWDTVTALECAAMEVVMCDLPVETAFDEADVRTRADLKTVESDVIRVVKIGDCDKSACCGAHVGTTGQIGIVRLCDIENKKQGTRVFFLAGAKALEYAQAETSVLRELRKLASCSTPELPAIFEKTLSQAKELAKEVDQLWSQMLPDLASSAEVVDVESSKVGIQIAGIPESLVAKLAGMIAKATAGVGIAVSGTRIGVSSATLSAGDLLKRIQATVGGKGGGSPKAANGSLDRATTTRELTIILKGH
jgi:alanyl-tRNA synthetase